MVTDHTLSSPCTRRTDRIRSLSSSSAVQRGDEEHIVVVLQLVVQMAEQLGVGLVDDDQNARSYVVAAHEQLGPLFQMVRLQVLDQRSNRVLASVCRRRQFELHLLAVLEQQLQAAFELNVAVQLGHPVVLLWSSCGSESHGERVIG